jgi:hypothetical protein
MKVTFVDPVNGITHESELFPRYIESEYPMIEHRAFIDEAFIVRVGMILGRPVIALTGYNRDIGVYYATVTYTDKPP